MYASPATQYAEGSDFERPGWSFVRRHARAPSFERFPTWSKSEDANVTTHRPPLAQRFPVLVENTVIVSRETVARHRVEIWGAEAILEGLVFHNQRVNPLTEVCRPVVAGQEFDAFPVGIV
jgi:hypothetical protein